MSLTVVVRGPYLEPKNLGTDSGSHLGRGKSTRDTFRCSNMLLRKSLEAPTHILRRAHKYKLLMACPSAVRPMYSEAVSPLLQQCQNQDL